MSESADGDSATHVQVALAGNIVDVAAGTVTEHQLKPAVARDHVLLKQSLNCRCLIPDYCRRRGNDFFHVFFPKTNA